MRTLVIGGVALAAGIALSASLVTRGDPASTPEPAPSAGEKRTPTETTETDTSIHPIQRNGQITSAERYLGEESHGYDWRDFDPVSGTALLIHRPSGGGPMEGLAVLGQTGPVATLTCGGDLPCSSDVATLGPGADEVTVTPGDRTAQVIGYDGTLRRTIDLTATVTSGEGVQGLRWSPDGSRLAVLTEQFAPRNIKGAWKACRVWLLDREGGDARLAYSLWAFGNPTRTFDASESEGRGIIWFPGWGWSWSPDGQALLLDVLTGGPDGTADGPVVVVLRLQPDGAGDQVIAQTLYHSNRHFDWAGNVAWSPDGTRIAVRTKIPGPLNGHRVTEISAEDGSVIAQHPHINDWLIWPARED